MNRPRGLAHAVWPAALLLLTSCSAPPAGLARFGDQTLTVAELDSYLLALPESARQPASGQSREHWLEAHIRRLALERLFTASQEMAALAGDAEVIESRQRRRAGALVAALTNDLAASVAPSPEEIERRAEQLAEKSHREPILNFQHIYFRLDLGGDGPAIRARARDVATAARAADADFAALAREHSDSANAASGGFVTNVRTSDLDPVTGQTLASLQEGAVSEVIESRSGLHVFRLIRRLQPEPTPPAQLEASARNILTQERLTAARAEILNRRQEAGGGSETGQPEAHFVAEAVARGLETPELESQLERWHRLALLERIFQAHREAHDAEIGTDRLRPFFDAQPSLFSTAERYHLELIFVPQGGDSYTTQKRLEKRIASLRRAADFAAAARELSVHASAGRGGDLGELTSEQVAAMGPAIASAVPELAEGEISEPIYCTDRLLTRSTETLRGGFAVLRLRQRIPARERSFDEALDDVRAAYALQHRQELDLEIQDQLLEQAGFELLRLPEPGEFLR